MAEAGALVAEPAVAVERARTKSGGSSADDDMDLNVLVRNQEPEPVPSRELARGNVSSERTGPGGAASPVASMSDDELAPSPGVASPPLSEEALFSNAATPTPSEPGDLDENDNLRTDAAGLTVTRRRSGTDSLAVAVSVVCSDALAGPPPLESSPCRCLLTRPTCTCGLSSSTATLSRFGNSSATMGSSIDTVFVASGALDTLDADSNGPSPSCRSSSSDAFSSSSRTASPTCGRSSASSTRIVSSTESDSGSFTASSGSFAASDDDRPPAHTILAASGLPLGFEAKFMERTTGIPLFTLDDLLKTGDGPTPSKLAWRDLISHLLHWGRLDPAAALFLLTSARAVLADLPNIIQVSGPTVVVGDVHGQLFDLLLAFALGGPVTKTSYLFLGDYVDRGAFSSEVLFILCAFVIEFPQTFHLLRGNHECRFISSTHGFLHELEFKYSDANREIFDAANNMFDALPLAAVYTSPHKERLFCCHGGISPVLMTLDDLANVDRFAEVPQSGLVTDLLWADPMERASLSPSTRTQWKSREWDPNCDRGVSYKYGPTALVDFLNLNNFVGIIRAHQVQANGFSDHADFSDVNRLANIDSGWPLIMTVFSAPNYCYRCGNQAAIMEIDENLKYTL